LDKYKKRKEKKRKEIGIEFLSARTIWQIVYKENGNKHVSYLPVNKTMGINMCHIYLLTKQWE
jgi:hypothetical protein